MPLYYVYIGATRGKKALKMIWGIVDTLKAFKSKIGLFTKGIYCILSFSFCNSINILSFKAVRYNTLASYDILSP